jgi:hypothetical protein
MGVEPANEIHVSSYQPLSEADINRIYHSPNALFFVLGSPVPISMDGTTFMEVMFEKLPHNPNLEGYKRFVTLGEILELIPSLREVLKYDLTTTVMLEYTTSLPSFQKVWSLTVYLPLSNGPMKFTLDPEGNILTDLPS